MRAPSTALVLVAMLGCGGERTEEPGGAPGKPTTESPVAPAPQSDTPTAELMAHHFDQGASARDAVVRGDLDAARAAAAELAQLEPTADMPRIWAPHLETMRAAARSVAEASDLDTAALEMGDLAASCGSCHAQVGAEVTMRMGALPEGEDTASHMLQHQWAADRLWEGLVIPDVGRFTVGAGALVDAPMHPSSLLPDQTVAPEIEALSRRVHELGRNASLASDDASRARLYGELLRTCADCHRQAGVDG